MTTLSLLRPRNFALMACCLKISCICYVALLRCGRPAPQSTFSRSSCSTKNMRGSCVSTHSRHSRTRDQSLGSPSPTSSSLSPLPEPTTSSAQTLSALGVSTSCRGVAIAPSAPSSLSTAAPQDCVTRLMPTTSYSGCSCLIIALPYKNVGSPFLLSILMSRYTFFNSCFLGIVFISFILQYCYWLSRVRISSALYVLKNV